MSKFIKRTKEEFDAMHSTLIAFGFVHNQNEVYEIPIRNSHKTVVVDFSYISTNCLLQTAIQHVYCAGIKIGEKQVKERFGSIIKECLADD
jgi:hypothetical protein